MNPLISIIIPVYNSENYINKCLDSVINQSYPNIEVILIDDGSKDNSLNICREYVEKYKFIKLFSQRNQGISAVRNLGIEKAVGEFVMFVDSDDYVNKHFCLSAIKNQQEYDSDIVFFDFTRVGKKESKLFSLQRPAGIVSKEETMEYLIENSHPWNKIYRRSLFKNIKYPVGKFYEDSFTTYKLFEKARSISYLPASLYNYVETEGSIVSKKTPQKIANQFEAMDVFFKFLKLNYLSVYKNNFGMLIIRSLRYLTYCPPRYDKKLFDEAKRIILENKIPEELEFKYKLTMKLFKFSSPLALLIFRIQKLRKRDQTR